MATSARRGPAISRRGTVLPASWTSPQVNLARGAAAAAAASRTRAIWRLVSATSVLSR